MPDTKPVQTRLTKQQLRILQFIYRFRHVSTKHITVFLGKAQIQQAQQRLNPLLKKKYIGRSYTNKDIQNNNYATYFLLPNGLRVLKQKDPEIDTDQLHLRRSDKTASDRFTTHNLRIGDVY
ncbi:MAG: replication-relaxation family protein, partial [Candidatus Saccharimonadales bacterium]